MVSSPPCLIFAIDPGSTACGWSWAILPFGWLGHGEVPVRECGTILAGEGDWHHRMIGVAYKIAKELVRIIGEHNNNGTMPIAIAFEGAIGLPYSGPDKKKSAGMAKHKARSDAARGAIIAAIEIYRPDGLPEYAHIEVSPTSGKAILAGSGRADKATMISSCRRRFPGLGEIDEHAADAVATLLVAASAWAAGSYTLPYRPPEPGTDKSKPKKSRAPKKIKPSHAVMGRPKDSGKLSAVTTAEWSQLDDAEIAVKYNIGVSGVRMFRARNKIPPWSERRKNP